MSTQEDREADAREDRYLDDQEAHAVVETAIPEGDEREALLARLRIHRYQRKPGGSILMLGPEVGADLKHVVDAVLAAGYSRTAPDESVIAEAVRQVYAEHGHPDDWGVQVIYVDQMIEHLTAALSRRLGGGA